MFIRAGINPGEIGISEECKDLSLPERLVYLKTHKVICQQNTRCDRYFAPWFLIIHCLFADRHSERARLLNVSIKRELEWVEKGLHLLWNFSKNVFQISRWKCRENFEMLIWTIRPPDTPLKKTLKMSIRWFETSIEHHSHLPNVHTVSKLVLSLLS